MKQKLTWPGNRQAANEADQAWQKLQSSIRTKKAAKLKAKQQAAASRKSKRKQKKRPTYAEYINSERWSKKRDEAFQHYGRKCCECGTSFRLQVHHVTYKTLFNERMQDLRVLCHDCHANHHEGAKPCVMDSMTREYLALRL